MHDDDSLKTMIRQLRSMYKDRKVRGTPLRFLFHVRPGRKVGLFAPLTGLSAIYLNISNSRTALQVFCTFTHELGHWCSWRDEKRTAEYEAAVKDDAAIAALPEYSRLLIFDEEVRAWTYGYRVAQEVGFADAQAYDSEALRALNVYRELLSITPELRPVFTVCSSA